MHVFCHSSKPFFPDLVDHRIGFLMMTSYYATFLFLVAITFVDLSLV